MKIEQNFSACFSCGACELRCPQKAVCLVADENGFQYPLIDADACVGCGLCDTICPALNPQKEKESLGFFYAVNKNDGVRKKSSSGGVFHALATSVLQDGGVVFGAAFDNASLSVRHCSTDEVLLDDLLRSKYVESDAKASYPLVKTLLSQGRKVLFCGTPCQIEGLYVFLGKPFENLITCDFVCHGVPSARFFRQHLEHIEKRFSLKLKNVLFRSKAYGWSFQLMRYEFVNGKVYEEPAMCDTFFRGFITENLFLRESCYSCPFTNAHPADITMADFWGFRAYSKRLNDEKGLSLISVNTNAGLSLWQACSKKIEYAPLDTKFAEYAFKKRVISPDKMQRRKQFLSLVDKKGFERAAKETYMKKTAKYKLKFLYKKFLDRGVHNV